MARAKQTNRAEARKRYRQATQPDDLDLDEQVETAAQPAANQRANARPAPAKSGAAAKATTAPARPGLMTAFRTAYHPAHPIEDLRALPGLLTHWSFLAAIGLSVAGLVLPLVLPRMTGSLFLCQLALVPGSALAPQLVAGFFAKRASYLLGLAVGLLQGALFIVFLPRIDTTCVGGVVTSDLMGGFVSSAVLTGPVLGALYAAAAAWYRRFLRESSPRRAQQGGKPGGKPAPKRATARR
ncbi:MAG TPA: hypothetical protein VFI15_01475 [Candidatus Limnocylindrales bacterium]|nr:hypothetical protein [Candidatus Limnocylindrales bacterium]